MFPGISSWITVPVQLAFSAFGVFLFLKAIAGLESAHEQGQKKEKRQKWSIIYGFVLIIAPWTIAPLIYNIGIALSPEMPGASKSLINFFKNPPVVTDLKPTTPITFTIPGQ